MSSFDYSEKTKKLLEKYKNMGINNDINSSIKTFDENLYEKKEVSSNINESLQAFDETIKEKRSNSLFGEIVFEPRPIVEGPNLEKDSSRIRNEMLNLEFDSTLVGKGYHKVKEFISSEDNNDNKQDLVSRQLRAIIEKIKKDGLLLPYLIEREAYGLLDEDESNILSSERNNNTLEEYIRLYRLSILVQAKIGMFGEEYKSEEAYRLFKECNTIYGSNQINKHSPKL